MGSLLGGDLGSAVPSFAVFQEHFGFVPRLFRDQALLPRIVEAEAALAAAIVFDELSLSRRDKERILLALAVGNRNVYCATAHAQMLVLLGEAEEQIDRIVRDPATVVLPAPDFLETVLTAAWSSFLCTLSAGLGTAPDFDPVSLPGNGPIPRTPGASTGRPAPPAEALPDDFPSFTVLREIFGFVPKLFRSQGQRPRVVEAEAGIIRAILLAEGGLTRLQKERILLAVSGANRNAYGISLHTEMLGLLGVSSEAPHLSDADTALLDVARKLVTEPVGFDAGDLIPLREHGFDDRQVLEALVATALANFMNTLQMGLGVEPDFALADLPEPAPAKTVNLPAADLRHTLETIASDPDAELVARVRGGDVDAFEELINRHNRRVYRTLVGLLGNREEACDAAQETFLKAFQHLGEFQGRSRFSTWLLSIAFNTGRQYLRDRKRLHSLDDDGPESDESFRPRELRAWADDPEQLCSKVEMRALVENSVMKLPAKYRTVVMLRDIEQLSTEEAAAALGLGIPAVKSRLLRGRFMLREALSPHFAGAAKGGVA